MPNHWILTCNPKRWGFFEYLAKGNKVTDIKEWSVATRLDQVTKGDDVALWVTGPKRGVYAVGVVEGSPGLGIGDEHWVDPSDVGRQRRFLPIKLTTDLTLNPVLGTELRTDPRFADATVITFPRGANPHRLDDRQWQAIVDQIPG